MNNNNERVKVIFIKLNISATAYTSYRNYRVSVA